VDLTPDRHGRDSPVRLPAPSPCTSWTIQSRETPASPLKERPPRIIDRLHLGFRKDVPVDYVLPSIRHAVRGGSHRGHQARPRLRDDDPIVFGGARNQLATPWLGRPSRLMASTLTVLRQLWLRGLGTGSGTGFAGRCSRSWLGWHGSHRCVPTLARCRSLRTVESQL
jgi:hypothetical protein